MSRGKITRAHARRSSSKAGTFELDRGEESADIRQIMGRPISTSFSDEDREKIITHVLAELCTGRSVRKIFREDEMPCDASTFWRWHFSDAKLQEQVERARIAGVEALMDETVDIADQALPNKDAAAKARTQIDARQKYAAMIAPRYKPSVDLTSGGEKLPAPAAAMLAQDNRIQALIAIAAARKEQGVTIDVNAVDEETKRLME